MKRTTPLITAAAVLAAAMPAFLAAQQSRITIGAGPAIGTTAGQEYFEEFQDWIYEDCRALDHHGDTVSLGEGDSARDLVAFYASDDPQAGALNLRADFHDLFFGAENEEMNLYILIDFDSADQGSVQWPDGVQAGASLRWDLSVALYSSEFWNIRTADGATLSAHDQNPERLLGAYYRADLDGVELALDRSLLTDAGWNGTSTLYFQVGTTKDFDNTLTDTLPDNGAVNMDADCPTAKYAFILHGNQALSEADYLQTLIHSDVVQTPNGNPTGYRRALETARIFGVPANIHVSATLLAGCLWAANEGQPDDGPSFVREIAGFVDGDPENGTGALIWGVFSEHIMPFFEGPMNQDSITLNEEYLMEVLDQGEPDEHTLFWIPERVVRGTTFADLVATGYSWTVLDQVNHLREWFGNEVEQGFKIHRINGVNAFMINDEPDRFKFANTDGGLWIDTRGELLELALDPDQEQIVTVFDDWEAYAGRSFLSFNEGSDNPDNFNSNIRWLANRPWIQVVNLEDVASWGWTPIDHGNNPNLPFETYDFLDHATEDSYENWYQGSSLEEDWDGFAPWIREDLGLRAQKAWGALSSYLPSNGATIPKGPGTITQDVFDETYDADPIANRLGRLNYATATFETAWHDEDNGQRCEDGTYCEPDDTFDNIAYWARTISMGNLRKGGIYARAAAWNASGQPGVSMEAQDVDHDGENEWVISNNRVFAVFENDGGRMIAAFARNTEDGRPVQLVGNLLGFGDTDDEREAAEQGGLRTSAFVDWWAAGPDTNQYVNAIYTGETRQEGLVLESPDGLVRKTISLAADSTAIQAAYEVDPSISTLYIRNGLVGDLENLLASGIAAVQAEDDGERFTLENTQTGAAITVNYAADGHSAAYNPGASDGSANSPRNQAMIWMTEISGNGSFSFALEMDSGAQPPFDAPENWMVF